MKKKNFKIEEIMKFLVGGGTAVITDFLLYKLLQSHGMSLTDAKIISFVSGAIVGFLINKLWTFQSKEFNKSEIIKYITLYACAALLNTNSNRIALTIWENQVFAFLCATSASTIFNFFGQNFFVFKKVGHRETNQEGEKDEILDCDTLL